jgi:hypothetical protein
VAGESRIHHDCPGAETIGARSRLLLLHAGYFHVQAVADMATLAAAGGEELAGFLGVPIGRGF